MINSKKVVGIILAGAISITAGLTGFADTQTNNNPQGQQPGNGGQMPNPYKSSLDKLVKAKTIKEAHEYGCKVIIWTVNSESEMKKLIKLGVDGLISDYPNIALGLR